MNRYIKIEDPYLVDRISEELQPNITSKTHPPLKDSNRITFRGDIEELNCLVSAFKLPE